mmetsp:Transcript_25948/g.59980  ORF Transcript_25948/g.59980 Transcript_25948/m.59980 type:complete len:357 (-) Transcript_25948:114-1184(-)
MGLPPHAWFSPNMVGGFAAPQANNRSLLSRTAVPAMAKRGAPPPGLELPIQSAAWGQQPVKVPTSSVDVSFSFPQYLDWDREVWECACPGEVHLQRKVSASSWSDEVPINISGTSSLEPYTGPDSPDASTPLGTNCIADLQELLQMSEHCRSFRCPPGASILQWTFMTQRKDSRVLHRAVTTFLHDGVPLHVAGEPAFSKKAARQSAAELALALVRGRTTAGLCESASVFIELADLVPIGGKGTRPCEAHLQRLRSFYDENFAAPTELEWSWEAEGAKAWSASLTLTVSGVLHTFHGPTRSTNEGACAELARRVLWYLGSQPIRGSYQPDGQMLLAAKCKVLPAPDEWMETLSIAA